MPRKRKPSLEKKSSSEKQPSLDKEQSLDKKSSLDKELSSDKKPLITTQSVVGVVATILTIVVILLGLPEKFREFVGPTLTPTSISYGNRCKATFDNNQVEYANIPELRAITDKQVLEIQLHLIDNLVGIDLGCEPSIPFSAQIETTLIKGDSSNFACLAFGGKPALQGTLESYFAFCISGDKRWLLLHADSKLGMQTLDEGSSDEILADKSKNLLNVKMSRVGLELFVNGHSIGTTATIDLKSNNTIGLAWATPKDVVTLAVWQADNLNVWELGENVPPTSIDFSMAAVKVAFRPLSLLTPIIETPQAVTDLHITTPIQISEHVASFILLDRSGSIVKDPRNESVSRQLLETLLGIAPSEDLIGIGTFAEQTQIIVPLTPVQEINLEPILSQLRQVGAFDDLPRALMLVYLEFQSLPNLEKKQVIVVSDDGLLSPKPEQEVRLREIIRIYREADIQLDLVVLRSDNTFLPKNPLEFLLKEEGVNFMRYDLTRFTDIPGVAMNAFYHNYTNRPGEIQFTLTSPAAYQLAVPPNAQKFVFFLSSQTDNKSSPSHSTVKFTTPSGEEFSQTLESGLSTFTQQNPRAGLWTIELSSSQPITFNGYSLMLLYSNP